MELIRLENITKTYHLGEVDVPVLKGVSLSIKRGEMVALMGASGSGKTTLMNILGCLDRPSSGQYWFDGEEMSHLTPNQRALVRSAKLGFVFQSFNLLPRTTATDNVVMPLDYSVSRPGSAETKRLAETLLSRVGLAERVDHEPSQMSGGQQQRVAIARSLVNRPSLVLADEPTGNLDSQTSVEILQMFQQLNAEGITVILVTHDAKVAAFAHRTVRIADGLIEADEVRNRPLAGLGASLPSASPIQRSWESSHISAGNGNGSGAHRVVAVPALAVAESASSGSVGSAEPAAARITAAAQGSAGNESTSLYGKSLVTSPGRRGGRLLPPTWHTALGALRRNIMRSVLTALGVIIGVGAVIAMTEIGEGSKIAIQKSIASMGANNLIIMPGAAMSGGISFGFGSRPTLTPEDANQLIEQCPAITAVAPIVQTTSQVVYGHNNWKTQSIVGTTPSYLDVRDWNEMEEGDVFTDHDVRNSAKVCMIGTTLKKELFEGESPLGKEIRIQNVAFRVIGVLSSKGANMMGRDQDDIVVAPWTTIKYRISGSLANAAPSAAAAASANTSGTINSLNNLYPGATSLYPAASATATADTPQPIRFVTVDNIIAKAASSEQIPQAIHEIKSLIRERHHIKTPQEDDDTHDDFNIRDMTEITKTITSTSTLMSVLLLIVAAISLVVGGVGIMNIMLVSVTERTREIGLRMAVGARSHHILRQFLVEAVVLCLVGGAIGILLGRFISIAVRNIQHWPTSASLLTISISVGVSALVGIIFGFYPAWRASQLDPIEALRYE